MNEAAKIAGVALIAALMLAGSGRTQVPDGWGQYRNERFGFILFYPPNLVPGPAAVDGSGMAFLAPDGLFSVFVRGFSLNDREENETWKQFFDKLYVNERQRCESSADYTAKKETWYVISGAEGGKEEYYYKVFYRGEDRNPIEFRIVYPHALRGRFDPLLEQIAKWFIPSIPGDYE